MLGIASAFNNAKVKRDIVFVLGGGNECTVAMARNYVVVFTTKLTPAIINEPWINLFGKKKIPTDSKHFFLWFQSILLSSPSSQLSYLDPSKDENSRT